MLVNVDLKKEFLNNFQKQVVTARKLLYMGNHKWSSIILNNLNLELEKNDWLGNNYLLAVSDHAVKSAVDLANLYHGSALTEYAVPNFIRVNIHH